MEAPVDNARDLKRDSRSNCATEKRKGGVRLRGTELTISFSRGVDRLLGLVFRIPRE